MTLARTKAWGIPRFDRPSEEALSRFQWEFDCRTCQNLASDFFYATKRRRHAQCALLLLDATHLADVSLLRPQKMIVKHTLNHDFSRTVAGAASIL